jgi:hypothetical protein
MVAVALAVVLALVASVTGAPVASAQEAPAAGNEAATSVPAPEVFEPGAVNRTPVGGPVPEQSQLLGGDPTQPRGERRELVERRTEDSETFEVGGGVLETVFYDGAVNYRDESGNFQRIDPTLVPAGGPGAAVRSKAGPVDVELPAVLGASPVRVSSENVSVAFTLRGATGVPEVGVPAAGAALVAPPEVARSSATYADALPGVSVTYTAMAEGVKEELVLADANTQTSFDFDVSLSEGLSAVATPDGGINIVDGAGAEQAFIDAPFLYDQAFARDGAASGYKSEAVSLSIVEQSPGLVLRLAADPAWLADPARAYPVVIDPTIRLIGSNADTTLRKAAPNTNYGSDDLLVIRGGTDTHRILYREGLFEEPVNVLAAEIQLYMASNTTLATPRQVSIHEMSTDWLSGQATWNQRKSGVNWATPGGDFRSPAVATVADATGPEGDFIAFPMREAVQAFGWKANAPTTEWPSSSPARVRVTSWPTAVSTTSASTAPAPWWPTPSWPGCVTPTATRASTSAPPALLRCTWATATSTSPIGTSLSPAPASTPHWTASTTASPPTRAASASAGVCGPSPRSGCTSPTRA